MQFMPISLRHQQFVNALIADPSMNQTAAYESVFQGRGDVATVGACKLMKRDDVKEAIAIAVAARSSRVEVTADDVLRDLIEVKDTSANELIEWRVGACRYCHGVGHQYQRRPQEYREALAGYMLLNRTSDPLGMHFDMQGGVGYLRSRAPHPDCPECEGEGEGWEYLKDSRKLSKGASTLYNGVKRGKNGVEVLMRSKDKAIDLLARHTGVARDNITLKGKITAAVATAVAPIAVTDPVEAARAYDALMKGE